MYTRLLLFTLVILYWSSCWCASAAILASAPSGCAAHDLGEATKQGEQGRRSDLLTEY